MLFLFPSIQKQKSCSKKEQHIYCKKLQRKRERKGAREMEGRGHSYFSERRRRVTSWAELLMLKKHSAVQSAAHWVGLTENQWICLFPLLTDCESTNIWLHNSPVCVVLVFSRICTYNRILNSEGYRMCFVWGLKSMNRNTSLSESWQIMRRSEEWQLNAGVLVECPCVSDVAHSNCNCVKSLLHCTRTVVDWVFTSFTCK